MQVFLWLFLFTLVVGGSVLLVTWLRSRRREAELWGDEERDQLAKWDEQSLGISEVRVHTERPALVPAPLEVRHAEPARPMTTPEASGASTSLPDIDITPSVPPSLPYSTEEPARPVRSRPEWWEQDASGAGALLRSLVEVTDGSAAIVEPHEGDYAVIAAAGAASAAIHAHLGARTIGAREAQTLADLPTGRLTVILGGHEAGILPGMDAEIVGETAVRALRAAPGSPYLILDVLDDEPLTERGERLIAAYADLAARLLDLPEDAPMPGGTAPSNATAPEAVPESPLEVALARIEKEIGAAREQGRDLSLAIVVPHDAEDLLEGDPEEIETHAAALRQRLLAVSATREVIPMGDLVLAALCEMKGPGAEKWVRDLTKTGEPVRIGIAVYGPRHVSPNLLRQDAVSALHQTYTTEELCVIVD